MEGWGGKEKRIKGLWGWPRPLLETHWKEPWA